MSFRSRFMSSAAVVVLAALTANCAHDATAPAAAIAPSKANALINPSGIVGCVFTSSGTTETLVADCQTNATTFVPDGWTLNGNGHSITAFDPDGGHFVGAVVANGGAVANVKNLIVTVSGLADVCDSGGDRLRGIMFDGASGSIIGNTVHDVRQVGSGCQEGNSIEVRNFGTNATTISVEIANNTITNFMKTGIVVNGNSNGNVHNNVIGASANQASLAANSIQFGFGAQGTIKANQVAGNQWCTAGDDATGILLYEADFDTGSPLTVSVNVTQNVFTGNANIGIYALGNGMTVNNNKVYDDNSIADCGDDFGIYNDLTGGAGANTFTNNKVGGFVTPYSSVTGGNNKTNPNK